jgi:hypothetical protein
MITKGFVRTKAFAIMGKPGKRGQPAGSQRELELPGP